MRTVVEIQEKRLSFAAWQMQEHVTRTATYSQLLALLLVAIYGHLKKFVLPRESCQPAYTCPC